MKKLSLSALFLLCSCYATSQPIFLPDGSSGYRLICGNYIGDTPDCLQEASNICGPNGYQMYDPSGHPKTEAEQTQAVIARLNTTGGKQDKMTDKQQHMFIKCKPSPVIQTPPVPDNKPIPLQDN